MNYRIKEIEKKDLYDYMKVNTLCWNESYKGIIEDVFLSKINNEIDKNVKRLEDNYDRQKIEEPNSKRFLLYEDNEPVGMYSVGKSRIIDYPNSGELCSLYLLNKVKNKGYGSLLFEKAKDDLKLMNFNDMVIGCLKDNPSNGFYKHQGAKLVQERIININGKDYKENIYHLLLK